ncbi:undecaprenyl-phosphate glucose phosphotransferase [Rhizorhabdus dicambivorans]|uniref:Undecaprenyl-phosphate glucose phosphotransferase n=1 Tax=Rhizorhabdus dicambivorans TaxID=1850238 RepID=A0A2A4FUN6_9SPHN|nr:undecaprenyl-phosphate glucose phosphotransferase [Rhizorhabdus dicambivorans]ATE66989.1 undecaprenyl-phosphate glucose phosphotransferase [Rhizorhabdus dicambivorans]PCE42135.1 undecaprenyl-phosphate glucose phosphotransferase [Rhizorhabdus dicambivorans]
MLNIVEGQIAAAEPRSRKYRFTSNVIATIIVGVDLFCLMLGALLAPVAYELILGPQYFIERHVNVAVIISVNFFLIRLSRNSYAHPMGRGGDSDQSVAFEFLLAALLVYATVWQLGVAKPFSTGLALCYLTITPSLLFVSRFVVRKLVWYLVQAGFIGQRIVIYGADQASSERVLRLLELERLPYVSVVGIADDRTTRIERDRPWQVPFLGGLDALVARIARGDVDMVVIALPMISQSRLDQITERLQQVSVDICLMPREALDLSQQYTMRFIGSLPLFALWQRPMRDFNRLLKAIEDRTLAILGLVLLSPLLLFTALVIKLTSRGPVLFRQERFGFNNVRISVLKFRSMYVDRQDVSGAERTTRDDPRVTPFGRIIRRLSIDELPQLFNVLTGEMSIVGPRPHATQMKVGDEYYFEAVRGYAARHRVKPGITGLAQVRGLRGEIATIERAKRRVEYDMYYIENWSLLLDLRIILETVWRLIWDRNVY